MYLNLLNFLNTIIHLSFLTEHYHFTDIKIRKIEVEVNQPTVQSLIKLHENWPGSILVA